MVNIKNIIIEFFIPSRKCRRIGHRYRGIIKTGLIATWHPLVENLVGYRDVALDCKVHCEKCDLCGDYKFDSGRVLKHTGIQSLTLSSDLRRTFDETGLLLDEH